MPLRIGYLASGAGSSAREIHAAGARGELDVETAVMISNNSGSGAIAWAHSVGVPTAHLSGRTHPDAAALDAATRDALVQHGTELVILSGYAKLVGRATLARFRHRILNVHPAPLPRFGGQGMYGLAVHQAVLDAGVPTTAVTIHLIDEQYDHGPTVAAFPVAIDPGDTAETLQARVHQSEGACYLDVLRRLTAGSLDLDAIAQGPS